jgi:hypothetical protein
MSIERTEEREGKMMVDYVWGVRVGWWVGKIPPLSCVLLMDKLLVEEVIRKISVGCDGVEEGAAEKKM